MGDKDLRVCVLDPVQGHVWAVIDATDCRLIGRYVWKTFQPNGKGKVYAITSDGKFFMHRLVMGNPDGLLVDHKDGDGLNNRKGNLRKCNHSQNRANQGIRSDSTAPYKGIRKSGEKWVATIRAGGEVFHLGSFSVAEDAAMAYDEAARTLFGEFSLPTFSEENDYRGTLSSVRAHKVRIIP